MPCRHEVLDVEQPQLQALFFYLRSTAVNGEVGLIHAAHSSGNVKVGFEPSLNVALATSPKGIPALRHSHEVVFGKLRSHKQINIELNALLLTPAGKPTLLVDGLQAPRYRGLVV